MHVPGWHERTKTLQEDGELQMLGIVQEQNPDRAALFMQWKQMTWPILVDTFDLLEVSVVPLTYAIDEHGIVRRAGLRLKDAETIREDFVERDFTAPETLQPAPVDELADTPANRGERALAIRAIRRPEQIDGVVEEFAQRVQRDPANGWAHFRLGAAHRLRHDSAQRRSDDFQRAVDHWQRALELDPNNYIWRRRIQQYGPRLDKPYPFYDWVERARREILDRGDQPVQLVVEPTGSEIAQPTKGGATTPQAPSTHPDPEARVRLDGTGDPDGPLIHIETTAVPARIPPGGTTRVHLAFRPDNSQLAHWNNEVEPLRVWLELPDGWSAEARLLTAPHPTDAAVSSEARHLEAELTAPESDARSEGGAKPSAVALYYVCEDVDGTCLYRRQVVELDVAVEGN